MWQLRKSVISTLFLISRLSRPVSRLIYANYLRNCMFLNLFEIRYPQCALSSGLEESQEVRQDQPDLGNVFPIREFRVFSKPLAALSSVSVQRPHQSDFMIPAIYSWARIMHLKVWLSQLFSGRRDGVDGLLKPSQWVTIVINFFFELRPLMTIDIPAWCSLW